MALILELVEFIKNQNVFKTPTTKKNKPEELSKEDRSFPFSPLSSLLFSFSLLVCFLNKSRDDDLTLLLRL
jgi:hypothetical protein